MSRTSKIFHYVRGWARAHPRLAAPLRAIWHALPRGWTSGRGLSRGIRKGGRSIFYESWYLADNPDAAASGEDPLTHYMDGGWAEGRDPHPLFDVSWYLGQHPEIAAAGIEPLWHYLEWGWREEWDPHVLFDASWYRSEYGQPETSENPLINYIERGAVEGRFVHPDHRAAVLNLNTKPMSRQGRPIRWAEVRQDGLDPIRSPLALIPWVDFDQVAIAYDTLIPARRDHRAERRRLILRDKRRGQPQMAQAGGAAEGMRAEVQAPDLDVVEIVNRRERVGKETLIIRGDASRDRVVAQLSGIGIDANDSTRVAEEVPARQSSIHVSRAPPGLGSAPTIVTPESPPQNGLDSLRANLEASAQTAIGLHPSNSVLVARSIEAAYDSALLYTSLVSAAVEAADVEDLEAVHYMTREGSFLARLHEVVAPILTARDQPPRAIHLALSRRSTFGPTLDSFTVESLMDIWRMYPSQSIRALVVSLGDKVEKYRTHARRHGLDIEEVIHQIQHDSRVEAFLMDGTVQNLIAARNRERRQALDSYLQANWETDDGRVLVVDVGWRGTIQDNLARGFPRIQFIGWYLALFPYLNLQPGNVTKSAIGPNGNLGETFAFMEPPAAVERPWTPDVPSVIDYVINTDREAVPVEERELLGHTESNLIEAFQDAAINAGRIVADWIASEGLRTDHLRPLVRAEAARFYTDPPPGSADIWFSSAHDDTFGALNITPFGKKVPSVDWFRDGLGHGFRHHLDTAAADSLWSSGYRRWLPVQALVCLERALRTKTYQADTNCT